MRERVSGLLGRRVLVVLISQHLHFSVAGKLERSPGARSGDMEFLVSGEGLMDAVRFDVDAVSDVDDVVCRIEVKV